MSLFGWGEEAKGIGKGVSTVEQSLRHLITGDIPPDVAVKLEEIAVEANKIHAQIVESDNKAGGINKIIRPATFGLTFLSWLALVWVEAFNESYINPSAMDRIDMLLFALVPSFFIYRTFEKLKGITK